MSSNTLSREWMYGKVDLWIGGHRPDTPEWTNEFQPFPPEGCRVPMSRDFPGIVQETVRYSWCFIAYLLPEKQGEKTRSWRIVYRKDIDERGRAERIRKDREGRKEY